MVPFYILGVFAAASKDSFDERKKQQWQPYASV